MLLISIKHSLNHSSSRDRLFSHNILGAIPLFDPAAPAARLRGAATHYMPAYIYAAHPHPSMFLVVL